VLHGLCMLRKPDHLSHLARRCDACMPGRQCAQDLVTLIIEDACGC
jgi:hypothetical protein